MYGRGIWSIAFLPKEQREAMLLSERQDERAAMHSQVPAPKPVIEWARDTAESLIQRMTERRDYWEKVIKDATEELKQTNVVLDGAQKMLKVVETTYPPKSGEQADPIERALAGKFELGPKDPNVPQPAWR